MTDYKLTIHNDGKGRYQSFGSALQGDDSWLYGYGENELEAIAELKAKVAEEIVRLQSINWNDVTYVGSSGFPLQQPITLSDAQETALWVARRYNNHSLFFRDDIHQLVRKAFMGREFVEQDDVLSSEEIDLLFRGLNISETIN